MDLTAAVPFGDGVTATDELSHITASREDDSGIQTTDEQRPVTWPEDSAATAMGLLLGNQYFSAASNNAETEVKQQPRQPRSSGTGFGF